LVGDQKRDLSQLVRTLYNIFVLDPTACQRDLAAPDVTPPTCKCRSGHHQLQHLDCGDRRSIEHQHASKPWTAPYQTGRSPIDPPPRSLFQPGLASRDLAQRRQAARSFRRNSKFDDQFYDA
jgi:hypothetical protein